MKLQEMTHYNIAATHEITLSEAKTSKPPSILTSQSALGDRIGLEIRPPWGKIDLRRDTTFSVRHNPNRGEKLVDSTSAIRWFFARWLGGLAWMLLAWLLICVEMRLEPAPTKTCRKRTMNQNICNKCRMKTNQMLPQCTKPPAVQPSQ